MHYSLVDKQDVTPVALLTRGQAAGFVEHPNVATIYGGNSASDPRLETS